MFFSAFPLYAYSTTYFLTIASFLATAPRHFNKVSTPPTLHKSESNHALRPGRGDPPDKLAHDERLDGDCDLQKKTLLPSASRRASSEIVRVRYGLRTKNRVSRSLRLRRMSKSSYGSPSEVCPTPVAHTCFIWQLISSWSISKITLLSA